LNYARKKTNFGNIFAKIGSIFLKKTCVYHKKTVTLRPQSFVKQKNTTNMKNEVNRAFTAKKRFLYLTILQR